jgi:hypothetical protein
VFWTAAIPNDDLKIDPFNGTAELHVQNLHLKDFFNLPNAVKGGPHDLGTVSFDVKWGGPATETVSVQDRKFHFGGTYIEDHATVTWSGRNDTTGFQFRANPGNFATTFALGGKPFAELGFESNGVFFQPDGRAASAHVGVVPQAVGMDQAVPKQSVAGQPAAQAASTGAIDQAFADLAGISFSDILRRAQEGV